MLFLDGLASAVGAEARDYVDDETAHDRLAYLIADVLDVRDDVAGA